MEPKDAKPNEQEQDLLLLDELVELRDRTQRQVNRIRDLEHALDQSLASLDELRRQSLDQQFLERQLASTEEYSNVQEQAIHQMRLQFLQQRAELEAKVLLTQERLEVLQSALEPESADAPADLKTSHRVMATDRVYAYDRVAELENQVQELEVQVAKQSNTQALLQQRCQELECDREQHQHRIAELERQAAEMQEQILSQAQQASEYETAIQHWKNRFYTMQVQIGTLKTAIETQGVELPQEAIELLATLEDASTSEPKAPQRRNPFAEDFKIDVPDFLARRRPFRKFKA